MRGAALLVMAALLAGPALAQDPPLAPSAIVTEDGTPYDAAILNACLSIRSGLRDRAGCIGIGTSRCTDALPMQAEAMSFAGCYKAEEAQWAGRLAETLAMFEDSLAASDKAEGAAPGSGRVDRLAEAGTAWEAYRDAECDLRMRVAEGSGSEPVAHAACRMSLTAERALAVEQDAQTQEGP